jgi:hypothetical protein
VSKEAEAWSWPLTSIYCRGLRMRGALHSRPLLLTHRGTSIWQGFEYTFSPEVCITFLSTCSIWIQSRCSDLEWFLLSTWGIAKEGNACDYCKTRQQRARVSMEMLLILTRLEAIYTHILDGHAEKNGRRYPSNAATLRQANRLNDLIQRQNHLPTVHSSIHSARLSFLPSISQTILWHARCKSTVNSGNIVYNCCYARNNGKNLFSTGSGPAQQCGSVFFGVRPRCYITRVFSEPVGVGWKS